MPPRTFDQIVRQSEINDVVLADQNQTPIAVVVNARRYEELVGGQLQNPVTRLTRRGRKDRAEERRRRDRELREKQRRHNRWMNSLRRRT
jgi:hypothetical protein